MTYNSVLAYRYVNCRIGSLEKDWTFNTGQVNVNCRIGSLES